MIFNSKRTHNIKKYRRLNTCEEFYSTILRKAESANQVYLACLALGFDGKTESLFEILGERIKADRKTILLVDKTRNTENDQFLTVIKKYNLEKHIIFVNNETSRFLPRMINEALSVFHTKMYIFDDEVLISGANLYKEYYIDRVDRYYLIKDVKFAEYCCKLVFDLTTTIDQTVCTEEDVYIDVQAEITHFDHSEEKGVFLELIERKYKELHITTSYLNMPKEYLIALEHKHFNLYTPSPVSNTFNNFGILNQFLTQVYGYTNYYTLSRLKNCTLYEFERLKWSFHKKGVWLFEEEESFTVIGSSNYNRRSVDLDVELSFIIRTKDRVLIDDWTKEVGDLKRFCRPHSLKSLLPRFGFWIMLLFYLFNIFF